MLNEAFKFEVNEQFFQARVYSIRDEKYVHDILETEVIESVWCPDPLEDIIYALCSTPDQLVVLKTKVPSGVVVKKTQLHTNIHLPERLLAIKTEATPKEGLKRVYFETEKNGAKNLSAQDDSTGKKFNFGSYELHDFNSDIVVKLKKSIPDQKTSTLKLQVFSAPLGQQMWEKKLAESRPINIIKCTKSCTDSSSSFATGDASGKIRFWRNESNFNEGHWHSLPIQCLEFTADNIYLLSGGQEGVIVKWEVKTMQKLCLVPRLNSTISHISSSLGLVLACTQLNTLKVFSSNFEDEGKIVGLTNMPNDKMIWHADSSSLMLIGPNRHHLQLFNPFERRAKICCETISQNVILGEREKEIAVNSMQDFAWNTDDWVATLELTWDNDCLLKFWRLHKKDYSLKLAAKFNLTNSKFARIQFLNEWSLLAFAENFVQVWVCNSEDKWDMTQVLCHLKLRPRAASVSADGTILAVGFSSVIGLYDMSNLELLCLLHHEDHVFSSLEFRSRHLMATSTSGIFIWDLIHLQLMGKFEASDARFIRSCRKNEPVSYFHNEDGLYSLDEGFLVKKLASGPVGHAAVFVQEHQRIYFLDGENGASVLKFVKTSEATEEMEVDQTTSAATTDLSKFNMEELKVSIEENIYHARQEPLIDTDLIAKKVSLSSEYIIKRSLPL